MTTNEIIMTTLTSTATAVHALLFSSKSGNKRSRNVYVRFLDVRINKLFAAGEVFRVSNFFQRRRPQLVAVEN